MLYERRTRELVHVISLTGRHELAVKFDLCVRASRGVNDRAVRPAAPPPISIPTLTALDGNGRGETHHFNASSKSSSHTVSGFESGKMMGRVLSFAIVLTTSSPNAFYPPVSARTQASRRAGK